MNRATKFYQSQDVYSDFEYINDNNLESGMKMTFNPVTKTVNTVMNLSLKEYIELYFPSGTEKNENDILLFWQNNYIQRNKETYLKSLILDNVLIAEVMRDYDGVIKLIKHNPDNCELVYNQNELILAKISGVVTEIINGKIKDYDVEKTYTKENGLVRVIVKSLNTAFNSNTVLSLTEIPVIKVESSYSLEIMLNLTDEINLKRKWLKNIEKMHGNAILSSTGDIRILENTKQNDGYKMITTTLPDAIQFVEMQGNIANLIKLEIQDYMQQLNSEYPEYVLATALYTTNVSTETANIKYSEIVARIESLRGAFTEFLVSADNFYLQLEGKNPVDHTIKYYEIIKRETKNEKATQEKMILELYKGYLESGNLLLLNEALERLELRPVSEEEWNNLLLG